MRKRERKKGRTRILPLRVVGVGLERVGAPGGIFEAEVRGGERGDGSGCEKESGGNHFFWYRSVCDGLTSGSCRCWMERKWAACVVD